MKFHRLVRGVGGIGLVCLAGCGGTDSNGAQPTAGASSQGGGANGGSSQGGVNPSGGGPPAGASSAGSNQGGASSVTCSGTFGPATVVLAVEPSVLLGSPTFSPDGLELIYARKLDAQIEFRRSVRSSADAIFTAGEPLPSLNAACQVGDDRSVDLSNDGLRAYVVCYSAKVYPIGPGVLHVAERAAVGQDFTLRPDTQSVAPSAAISSDELTLYTSSDIDPGEGPPRQFTRSAASGAFGPAMDIPGLEQAYLTAPEPSPDGLALFGGLMRNLTMFTRATVGEPFGAPTVLVAVANNVDANGAPELSKDCRSLFYVMQTYDQATNRSQAALMVMRR